MPTGSLSRLTLVLGDARSGKSGNAANLLQSSASNELGLGIVRDTPLMRQFRDAQGRLDQRVADIADHVVLMAADVRYP